MSKKVMKLALEVLEINLTLLMKIQPYKGQEDLLVDSLDLTNKAITALKELAEQPAQRTWVDLTDEDIESCYGGEVNDFARAVLAKSKEKNT